MRTTDFHFDLPDELIAQSPAPRRDDSRLLVLRRPTGTVEHRRFTDLAAELHAGDVLVLNDSRVIPARLRARKSNGDGAVEILLLEEAAPNEWWAMLRPGRRVRPGTHLTLIPSTGTGPVITAVVLEKNDAGHGRLRFAGSPNLLDVLPAFGEVPLPPYIGRPTGPSTDDVNRYQTVYAQPAGSVAAPTAGLHFTDAMLTGLRATGVEICFVTLHVGLGTFAPVKVEDVEEHAMHEERYVLPATTAATVNRAKRDGRRVIAVGTTTVRTLESAAVGSQVAPGAGRTRIFIHPPHAFQIVNALLTNFHLPASTLLMLVSAFAAPGEMGGRELVLAAYAEAVRQRYRFFSYGDAMWIS